MRYISRPLSGCVDGCIHPTPIDLGLPTVFAGAIELFDPSLAGRFEFLSYYCRLGGGGGPVRYAELRKL